MEALTPDGVMNGTLVRHALSTYQFDDQLLPVDDELVRRLGLWRKQAFEFVPKADQMDEQLQMLFAQLFVLRVVEDRELADNLPALRSVLRGETVDREALATLYTAARPAIQSDLFAEAPYLGLPDHVLSGIIRDLYNPPHLPHTAQYNFAWLDVDVLGRAYEKYLSTIPVERPPVAQADLFREPIRTIEERSVQKQSGVYYTPTFLVRSLTAEAIDKVLSVEWDGWSPDHPTPKLLVDFLHSSAEAEQPALSEPELQNNRLPYIADFACGSGHFLVVAADHLLRRLRAIDPDRPWARELIEGRHIVGIDVDPRAVTLTKMNLWIRLAAEERLPLPALDRAIICADSLSSEPWDQLPSAYDVVLGNPPFIAAENAPVRADDLAARFETAKGRFDYAYLFVELAVTKLKTNGVLSLVVPNRLFRNKDAGVVRALLTRDTDMLLVTDFGSEEVFKGTSAYIGTITARRRGETDPEPGSVRVIRVKDTRDKFLGAMLTRAARARGEMNNDIVHAFDAAIPPGPRQWLMLSPQDQRKRVLIDERSVRLGEIAVARQGIRTGANDIFVVEAQSPNDEFSRIVNGLGESVVVETALLRPVVFGSEIRRFDRVLANRYVLYPYRRGVLLEEPELVENYPRTWDYLQRYRSLLAARSSLSPTARWYGIIRPRENAWLESQKLVIRDLAVETAFAIDDLGGTYLIGGSAVIPHDPEFIWCLLGYLNTRLVSDYLRQATPAFRGGFQKFEPRHLEDIPVPHRLLTDSDCQRTLALAAKRAVFARLSDDEATFTSTEKELESAVQELVNGPVIAQDFGGIDKDEIF